MRLNPGQMDTLLDIQQRTVTRDPATGAELESWAVWAAGVWAKLVESAAAPAKSGEAAELLVPFARPTRAWLHWRPGFDKQSMRLAVKTSGADRILRVTGSAEHGRQEAIELVCEEWAHQEA